MTERHGAGSSARSSSGAKGAICFKFKRDGEGHRVKLRQDVEPGNWMDIPTIERVAPDAREYADRIPKGPLPGSGQRNDDCGDPIPALFCPEPGCGEVYEPGRTCRRSRCPRCWQSWAFRRATTRAAQLESLGRKRGSNGANVKQHHLTVSFRDSTRFNSKTPLDRAVKVVKRFACEVNMDTGVIIFHPYRIAEEYRGNVTGHKTGRGDMTWADILGKVEDEDWTWEAVEDEFLAYAPHFHVIGLSEFVQTGAVVDEIEAKTGAVIHRITDGDSSVSIYSSLNNQIEFEATFTGDPMKFDVAVTGETELDNGRRVERARGELDPHYQRKKELDYSGAIKNLSVEGQGKVTIRQKGDYK